MAPKKKRSAKSTGGAKKGTNRKGAPRKKKGGFSFRRYGAEIVLGVLIGALSLGILFLVVGGESAGGGKKLTAKKPVPVSTPAPMLHFEEELPPHPVESLNAIRVEPEPEKVTPVPAQPVYQTRSPEAHGPMVAVIIDDLGADMEAARRLAAIALPITFAVLPYLPHSQGVATLAHAKGRTVMLHLPMQPSSTFANPGYGALKVDMSDDQLVGAFTSALSEVPYAEGVNNHMGSLFTENAEKMKLVVKAVKDAGLFFIDSRTSAKTEAAHKAKAIGLPVASRDVFLDNEQDVEKIIANMRALAAKARRNGAAIGIGHPYRQTVTALEQVMPELADEGIVFVPAGALVSVE